LLQSWFRKKYNEHRSFGVRLINALYMKIGPERDREALGIMAVVIAYVTASNLSEILDINLTGVRTTSYMTKRDIVEVPWLSSAIVHRFRGSFGRHCSPRVLCSRPRCLDLCQVLWVVGRALCVLHTTLSFRFYDETRLFLSKVHLNN
jgi:hypothetical protein